MVVRDGTSEVDPDRDYIRQQIQKLIELFRRIAARADGAEKAEGAMRDLQGEASRILGAPVELLERLSPLSAAAMLGGDLDRLSAYARIVALEAELRQRGGDGVGAGRQTARAVALYREVLRRDPDDGEAGAEIRRLEEPGP